MAIFAARFGEIMSGAPYRRGALLDDLARHDASIGAAFDEAQRVNRSRVYVHDRKKNMIISGGENIYAAEIERVLLEHPDVADCGVIGRPDPKWDEVPVAYIVCRENMTIGAEEVKTFVGQHLARFKIPREVVFVKSLPRTALGKVQHFMLRETLPPSS